MLLAYLSDPFSGLSRFLVLPNAGRGAYLRGQVHRKLPECFAIFQAIEEALGNTRQPGLGSGERPGQNGARLVLPAAIHGVQHSRFEVAREAGGQVVGRRKLVVDGAGHSIYEGHLPRRFYRDARVRRGGGNVRRR